MSLGFRHCVVASVFMLAGAVRAQPFSVSAPGQAIQDNAVTVISLAMPAGLQQVDIFEMELGGLSHSKPQDLDIYLVNPFGAFAEIMTDRGGSVSVSGLTLTYSDTASSVPPEAGPLLTGLYQPEGLHEATDGGLASLSTTVPTMDAWNLLIIDDGASGAGSFESFTLRGVGVPAPVPTVSEWGLLILTLAGLAAGTILFRPAQTKLRLG